MKNLLFLTVLFFGGYLSMQAQDHTISASAQLGWSVPGGSGVSDEVEDLNLDGGLVWGVDVLYHIKENIGVGVIFNNSILAGATDGDIDIFGMRMFGVKGLWMMKPEGFSPFAGLSLGVAQLLTPEYSVNGVLVEEQVGGGFGLMPEVGLRFGKFFISGQYLVPVKYTIENVITDKSVGVLNINVGYRYSLSF